MEEFSTEHPSARKREDNSLLLGSKDPQLSHLFGDDPKTPSGLPAADVSNQTVMEDGTQFQDDRSGEPEYRLFGQQNYVPDLAPTNHIVLDGSSKTTLELASGSKIAVQEKIITRSNGPTKGKAVLHNEPNCGKSSVNNRILQKHISVSHPNDLNNNAVTAANIMRQNDRSSTTVETATVAENPIPQNFETVEVVGNPEYQQSTSVVIPSYNRPSHNQTGSAAINTGQSGEVLSAVNEGGFSQQPQESANQYNMQLLAQHAAQNPAVQHSQSEQIQQNAPEYLQHQGTRALQQIAMNVNLRSTQNSSVQETMSSVSAPMVCNASKIAPGQQQFMPLSGPITGVRAQLRKSLSSNGKLENNNASTREWPRLQIPVGRSLDSSTGAVSFLTMRLQPENDPSNIDNAPILKNLLADAKPERRMSSSESTAYIQENGHLGHNAGYTDNLGNSWPGDHTSQQGNLRSPLLEARRNELQYHRTISEQQSNPNPSPLHSPSYANNPQFTMPPQPQSHHNTPLPQSDEQQFFAADSIMVNNNNNQQMDAVDESAENLHQMIKESENLVDLIEAEANSNQSQQRQMIPYGEARQSMEGSQRITPPPAYSMDAAVGVMQSDPNNSNVQMYMGQAQIVKSEPQSPMIMSPMGQRSFFGSQGNPMAVHPTNMPLSSPTTPHHQVPMQPGMHPHTPVGEANWQFPMSGQAQNFGSVPQSPVTPGPVNPINMSQASGQENIVQNVKYLPQPALQPAPGPTKSGRARRTSGGAARKNPDGTLSCAICGHSFRSVPALNGHMRVHSSSADRKNKDERHRKQSGSSSGGNESRTPQSLSSPTTPTFSNKAAQPVSMYQNTAAYNSVTLPGYSNPSALYSPALSTMDAAGAVVPISQNVNPRDGSLVHRINPQTGIYPYALPHTAPMQPHDALLAAANLLARSEPDHGIRAPGSNHEEYGRNGGTLQQVTDLQSLIAQQQVGQGRLELAPGYHNSPSSGVILVSQQPTAAHSYLSGQGEPLPGTNPSAMPFVTAVPLAAAATSMAAVRQAYANSPPQEQTTANSSQVDNIQYLQQSLIQQTSNRSTPLADFADIAVLHDQGQLFTNNSMLAPLGAQNQSQQQEEGHQNAQQQDSEQMRLQDVSSDVGLLACNNDLLWPSVSQQPSVSKITREEGAPLKEEDFLQSSMAQMQKSNEQIGQPSQNDPFFFHVSIPVQCSRDEAAPVTTTLHNLYRQNPTDVFANNSSSFHDDPLVQEAINVANPSTILPNSMMGGNPSGFRSIRQRHHSEGSILKKTWQTAEMACKEEMKSDIQSLGPSSLKVQQERDMSLPISSSRIETSAVPIGSKRKVDISNENGEIKKVKTENDSSLRVHTANNGGGVKKEVWSVPKHAAPNRQRHRRHSADSRLQYKSSSLFPRSAYLPTMQVPFKNVSGLSTSTNGSSDSREKRRPPPLIIPASVNAYSNGPLYISHLHHRRRPSGDSGSSCGNEKIPPYTPPPMLSPVRLGTGLYYNTPGTPSIKAAFRPGNGEICPGPIPPIPEEEVEDDLIRSADPKINIGEDYQADIPNIRPRWKVEQDTHKAELVWKPTDELRNESSTQSRHVEEFLKLACSAAVPYGGCNKEFALHLLFENKGDILSTVRQLLHSKRVVSPNHWMSSYTYLGSSKWSQKEIQTFERAMMEHHKDFYQVAKGIQTKTTAECVDYYYHSVKRRRRRIQRPRRFRHDSEEDDVRASSYSPSPNGMDSNVNEETDFLQDYSIAAAKVAGMVVQQEDARESKTSEVLLRSPPQTAFIKAPSQVNRAISTTIQPAVQASISYPTAAAQHIPQIHSYARQPTNYPGQTAHTAVSVGRTREYVPPHQRRQQQQQQQPQQQQPQKHSYPCKVRNCGHVFQSIQTLLQHQQTHKHFLERLNQASPSPSNSPASVASADTETPRFECPRCGRAFPKVKSRNAHMKTHGKLAEEKRKQKEEEQRRKMEEAAAWRNRAQHHQAPILHHPTPNREQLIHYQRVPSPLREQTGM